MCDHCKPGYLSLEMEAIRVPQRFDMTDTNERKFMHPSSELHLLLGNVNINLSESLVTKRVISHRLVFSRDCEDYGSRNKIRKRGRQKSPLHPDKSQESTSLHLSSARKCWLFFFPLITFINFAGAVNGDSNNGQPLTSPLHPSLSLCVREAEIRRNGLLLLLAFGSFFH